MKRYYCTQDIPATDQYYLLVPGTTDRDFSVSIMEKAGQVVSDDKARFIRSEFGREYVKPVPDCARLRFVADPGKQSGHSFYSPEEK